MNETKSWSLFSILTIIVILINCLSSASVASNTVYTHEIPNFHQVAPGIYRGGAPTPKGLKTLRSMGIQTIIDLRIERALARAEKKTTEAMGFNWINLPMGREAPTQRQIDIFLATLAKAPATPVFVHCQHGADRTGCMVGIYRVQVQGITFSQAWTEMRSYGFKPFLSQLKAAVRKRANTD